MFAICSKSESARPDQQSGDDEEAVLFEKENGSLDTTGARTRREEGIFLLQALATH
jgi:hypothetical protein